MVSLKDKVVLITGASRGVGYATAVEMVKLGAKLMITARGEERLKESAEKLKKMGGKVEFMAGDVSNFEDAQKMVEHTLNSFDRLDILINNAGVSMRGQFTDLSRQVIDQTMNINLMGSLYLTKVALEQIIENKGSIVFISSIAGLFGLPGASTYCAGKQALTGLCESLRLELLPKGVHIGVVHLGFTEHDPQKRILAADGTLIKPDRPAHHTQSHAANLIVKMVRKRKRKIIMTAVGKLGYFCYRLSPTLVEKAILWAQSSNLKIFKEFS